MLPSARTAALLLMSWERNVECFTASDPRSAGQESHVPISEVVPELDGELPENMYAQTPARGIVLDKIREVGRERGDLTTAPE